MCTVYVYIIKNHKYILCGFHENKKKGPNTMRRLKALMFQKTKGPSGFRKIADPPKKHPQTDLSIFVRVGKPLSKLQGLFSDNPSRLVVEKICASPFFFMIPFEVDVKMTHQKKRKKLQKAPSNANASQKNEKTKNFKKKHLQHLFFQKSPRFGLNSAETGWCQR